MATSGLINIGISNSGSSITRVNIICRNKTTQIMTDAIWNKNTNWIKIQDPTNSFNEVTGVFTAPRMASYAFSSANRTPVVADGGEYGQAIFLNNGLISGNWGRAYLSTNFSAHISGVINMVAGDILDVRTIFEGGANGNDAPTVDYSWFTITEITPTL